MTTKFHETSEIDGDMSLGSVGGSMFGGLVVAFPVLRVNQGERARRCWAMLGDG